MEQVLKDSQKVIIDPQVKNVQSYLPLPELGRQRPAPAPMSPSALGGKP